jgi:SAM-dependent methyltransferase
MDSSEYLSVNFWDQIYRTGGTSGTGSAGRLAQFKAEIVNGVVAKHRVDSVIELGCGDGSQLALMQYTQYFGLDTSVAAIERCTERFADDPTKQFVTYEPFSETQRLPGADLAVSLDVVYHLLEDAIYERYMRDLFAAGRRFVLIYSSDTDAPSPWGEVRHRRFTEWVERREPHWNLAYRIPQRFPYVEGDNETSWSDFSLYTRVGTRILSDPQQAVQSVLRKTKNSLVNRRFGSDRGLTGIPSFGLRDRLIGGHRRAQGSAK